MSRSRKFVCLYQKDKSALIFLVALIIATSSGLHCHNDPCMYGICLDDTNSSYSCYCIDGYTGINCEINWDDCWSSPCLNGGTCNDAVATYNCTCIEGFTGVNCEQKFSECLNQPCLNNGTCFDYNGFTCQCPEGYSGDYCEIDASVCNNTICKHSGACIEGPGFSFSCRCLEGWTGKLCEEDIDECVSLPCQNGGLCINMPATYTCACLFGFTGKDCDKAIIPCELNPCENDAICLLEDTQPICYCVPDYHGSLCELKYNDCESKFAQCKNGGSCIDGINNFTCACPPQYTGVICSEYKQLWTTIEFSDVYSEAISSPATSVSPLQDAGMKPILSTTESIDESSTSTFVMREIFYGIGASSTESTTSPNIKEATFVNSGTESVNVPVVMTTPEFINHTTEQTDKMYPVTNATVKVEEHSPVTNTSDTEQIMTSFVTNTDIFTTIFTPNVSVFKTTMFETTTALPASEKDSTTFSKTSSVFQSSDLLTTLLSESTSEETSAFTINKSITKINFDKVTQNFSTNEVTTEVSSLFDNDRTRLTTLSVTDIEGITSPSTLQGNTTVSSMTLTTTKTSSIILTTSIAVASSNLTSIEPVSITSLTSSVPFIDKSYILSTSDYINHSEIESIEKNTEKDLSVYNCTQEQCTNTTLCLNGFTECDCSYQSNCSIGPSITSAAFNGKSYVRQQFFVNDDGSLQIFVRLRTRSKSGILVHASFDDERYILLYMEAGQLKFQFSCGLQTMLLGELDSPINNGYNIDVEMRFQYLIEHKIDKCSARLLINDTIAMSGEQIILSHDNIPRQVTLHLGGLSLAFSHYFPYIATGFVGCMSLLKVNNIQKHFTYDSTETFQVKECTSFLCLSNPCHNFGVCQDIDGKIHCECIAGHVGEFCEKSVCDDNPCHFGATCINSPGTAFLCICPLGKHGLLCEQDIIVVQPSFSGFLSGFSSYVAYKLTDSIKDNMEFKMRFIPHSIEQISLIAYMGQSGSRQDLSDHFSVTYVRGYIMLTWDLGSGVRRIFTNTPLTPKVHKPYTLRVGRRGKDAWLSVDGLGNVTGRAAGPMTRLDVSPILYVGGHKTKNFEMLPHDLPLHTGFSGCIFDIELYVRNTVLPVTKSSPATGRGVGECYRDECTHRSCKNGAVCLNHGPTYSCVCMKDWHGPDCSTPAIICSFSGLQCQKSVQ